MLDRIAVDPADTVCFVGDLVARGPDTRGVLALFREVRACGVRGNHDHRLLEAHEARQRGEPGPRLGPSHLDLLRTLESEDWALLDSLPLWLDLAEHGVRVVHAGVRPGVPIEEHSIADLTLMRTLLPDSSPSEKLAGTPWAAVYRGPPHVVFGHNARAGLQLHRDATGLDSGCVYGGRLSALVLSPFAPPLPAADRQRQIVSVKAEHRYYVPHGA